MHHNGEAIGGAPLGIADEGHEPFAARVTTRPVVVFGVVDREEQPVLPEVREEERLAVA